jgi:dTDP-4-amino-4,6-dideoxygalactose transaminase
MNVIPFVDLRAQYFNLADEIDAAIKRVLVSASFILGPDLSEFERQFANFCGARYCVGVASGTAALKIALQALGVGAGDEVILPANTYVATALAVSQVGATPVLVDVGSDYLIDPELIEPRLTSRTKAIIPVHLYGQAARVADIQAIAQRHGLWVIEDAAQAHGARTQSGIVGCQGDVGCFSFYPGKNLGAYGDGGAIVTNNARVAETALLLRDFGQRQKYEHVIKGDNCRLDTLQAAILSVKLKYLDHWNNQRRRAAQIYDRELSKIDGVARPPIMTDSHVYHLYVIEIPERDRAREFLRQHAIETGIHYPVPIHRQPAFADLNLSEGTFPNTERAARRILSLPIFPEIAEMEIVRVTETLKTFLLERNLLGRDRV